MADIEFDCPECLKHLAVDEAGAGRHVPCPECGKPITIPATQPLSAIPSSRLALLPARMLEPCEPPETQPATENQLSQLSGLLGAEVERLPAGLGTHRASEIINWMLAGIEAHRWNDQPSRHAIEAHHHPLRDRISAARCAFTMLDRICERLEKETMVMDKRADTWSPEADTWFGELIAKAEEYRDEAHKHLQALTEKAENRKNNIFAWESLSQEMPFWKPTKEQLNLMADQLDAENPDWDNDDNTATEFFWERLGATFPELVKP